MMTGTTDGHRQPQPQLLSKSDKTVFYINYIAEFAAFATGISLYSKLSPVSYRLLVFVLFLTVVNEGCSYFGFYYSIGVNKGYFYNGFFLTELIAFFFIFRTIYFEDRYKRAAQWIILPAVPTAIFFLFRSGLHSFSPMFINVISIALIAFGLLYVHSVYKLERVHRLRSDPAFWLSLGVVLVNFFLLLFANATYVDAFRTDPTSAFVFRLLNTIGNIFYYGCLILCFVCSYSLHRRAGI